MSEELPQVLPKPLGTSVSLNRPHLSEKDSRLLITPEKTSLLMQKSSAELIDENTTPILTHGVLIEDAENEATAELSVPECVDRAPTKLSSLITDPTLDITPEKLKTALKSHNSLAHNAKSSGRTKASHVRFTVPAVEVKMKEKCDEVSIPMTVESSFIHQDEPFEKRAALYAQRNPLGEVTADSYSQESSENSTFNFESSASTNTDSSFFSSKFHKHSSSIAAEKATRTTPVQSQPLPQVKLKTVNRQSVAPLSTLKKNVKAVKERIIVIKPENNNRSKLIEQATRPRQLSTDNNLSSKLKHQFLKKNSTSHRHKHTVRYDVQDQGENSLSTAAYNTTLALGQKLQELKTDEFDAKDAVKKKMEESERFRTYVAEKTAEATNIDPEEIMYQNLVSVSVPDGQILSSKSTRWKRISHNPHKPKVIFGPEPNIWDFYYPDELYEAEPEFGAAEWIIKPRSRCGLQIKPWVSSSGPSPINAAEKLDNHERLWSGAWGRHLPQEEDRIDLLP